MEIRNKDTKLNLADDYVIITTFVKGLYALEPQTVDYCKDKFKYAGFNTLEEGYAIYTEKEGGEHYREHRDKYINSNGEKAKYYPGLIKYITESGPVYVMIFAINISKIKNLAWNFGLEIPEDISKDELIQKAYDMARIITKKCREEVLEGHEEGRSITKIQFDDPIEGPRTMNVMHCSDCRAAAEHEFIYALVAKENFKKAEAKNPKIIEDSRKELMSYEFGDEVNY